MSKLTPTPSQISTILRIVSLESSVSWLRRRHGLRSFPRPPALRAVHFGSGAFCFGSLAPHERANVDLLSAVRAFHTASILMMRYTRPFSTPTCRGVTWIFLRFPWISGLPARSSFSADLHGILGSLAFAMSSVSYPPSSFTGERVRAKGYLDPSGAGEK